MVDSTSVEVALQYNDGFAENVLAFANNIHTVDGGTHVTGFRAALTGSLNDWARKSGTLSEKEATSPATTYARASPRSSASSSPIRSSRARPRPSSATRT